MVVGCGMVRADPSGVGCEPLGLRRRVLRNVRWLLGATAAVCPGDAVPLCVHLGDWESNRDGAVLLGQSHVGLEDAREFDAPEHEPCAEGDQVLGENAVPDIVGREIAARWDL